MLTVAVRPYAPAEKEQLLSKVPTVYERMEKFTMLALSLFIGLLIPFLLLEKYVHVSSVVQISVCVLVTATAVFLTVSVTKKNRFRSLSKEDIESGNAEVIHVVTNRAIKRQDPEDFGVGFYLEVVIDGSVKTLYLQGQYLDELDEKYLFPNTNFELVREIDRREFINIKLMGNYFEPERVLPPVKKEEWQNMPADAEILEKSLDEIN